MVETAEQPRVERIGNDPYDDSYTLSKEMARLYSIGDVDGMKTLYDSYLERTRNALLLNIDDRAEEITRDNFLMVSKLANLRDIEKYRLSSSDIFCEGPISRFYREAIGFPKE